MKRLISVCVAMLLFGIAHTEASWTTIDFPGAISTDIYGIEGSNLVGSYYDDDRNRHGFFYNISSGMWTTLDFPGASATVIQGIDESNLVGWYGSPSRHHGFLYNGTTWTTLDMPVTGSTYITGIDGSNIVGFYSGFHGFLYDGTTWTTLDMPKGSDTTIRGIDASNLVGSYYTGTYPHGFLFDGTTWTTIDMPAAMWTHIGGIDGSNLVGMCRDASGSHHSVLYDGTTWTTLDFPGALHTVIEDIDGSNLVGYYRDASNNTHGFIYEIPKPATVVAVDIKPGSCPNPVNVKSKGVLPVAILGTGDYDVTTIDPTSIRLSGVEPLRSGYEDVATPVADANDCNCTEEGPDGFLDLTLKFKTQRIVEAVGDVNDGDVRVLTLTGVLFDPIPFETPIEGADCILIKGRHRSRNKADINGDGVVNSIDFAIIAENWLRASIVEE